MPREEARLRHAHQAAFTCGGGAACLARAQSDLAVSDVSRDVAATAALPPSPLPPSFPPSFPAADGAGARTCGAVIAWSVRNGARAAKGASRALAPMLPEKNLTTPKVPPCVRAPGPLCACACACVLCCSLSMSGWYVALLPCKINLLYACARTGREMGWSGRPFWPSFFSFCYSLSSLSLRCRLSLFGAAALRSWRVLASV